MESKLIDVWVPETHIGKTLENFDWSDCPKVKDVVCKVCEKDVGLVLFGDPGVGKTHILVGMFTEFVVKRGLIVGQDILFCQWSDLINEIIEVTKDGKVFCEEVVDRITSWISIMIVDDIRPGWGRVWNDVLKRLVEKMYERKIKFICSTNAEGVDDLVVRLQLEDYWLSRLKEMCVFVKLQGQDKRRPARV